MTFREKLVDVLEGALSEEKALLVVLSEKEKDAVGTYERWTGKDHIAHAAEWADRYAGIVEARRRKTEPPNDGEEANREIFEKYRSTGFEAIEVFADKAQEHLLNQLAALSDEELAATTQEGDGRDRPQWRTFVGAGYIHVITHLDMVYLRIGDKAGAARITENAATALKSLDDADDWTGRIHYNLACHYALSAEVHRALGELREALRLAPDISEWSKEDPDLEALRGMAEYKKLYD